MAAEGAPRDVSFDRRLRVLAGQVEKIASWIQVLGMSRVVGELRAIAFKLRKIASIPLSTSETPTETANDRCD